MNFYTYLYRDPSRNNEPIYVGKGKGDRAFVHLKRCGNRMFANRLAKMKRNGINPVIEFLCTNVDEELAFLVEAEAIDKYGRRDNGKGTLLNHTNGGDGISGYAHTAETKRKIAEAKLGSTHSTETKKRLSECQKGKPRPIESVEKTAASNRGKTRTAETKQRMSAWQIGRKMTAEAKAKMSAVASKPRSERWLQARSKRCTIDGKVIYDSVNDLKQALGQGKSGYRHPNFRYVMETDE